MVAPHPALAASYALAPSFASYWPTISSLPTYTPTTPLSLLRPSPSLDPLHGGLTLLAVIIFVTYTLSVVTRNVSQVDRLWTYIPVWFSAYYAFTPVARIVLASSRALSVQEVATLAWEVTDKRALLSLGLQVSFASSVDAFW